MPSRAAVTDLRAAAGGEGERPRPRAAAAPRRRPSVSCVERRSACPGAIVSRCCAESVSALARSGRRARGLGDPVEHDAEQHDGEPGGQPLAEQAALREAGDDVVAERAARRPGRRPRPSTARRSGPGWPPGSSAARAIGSCTLVMICQVLDPADGGRLDRGGGDACGCRRRRS